VLGYEGVAPGTAGRVYRGRGYSLPWTLLHAEAEAMKFSSGSSELEHLSRGGLT